jgi:hypothetical protein
MKTNSRILTVATPKTLRRLLWGLVLGLLLTTFASNWVLLKARQINQLSMHRAPGLWTKYEFGSDIKQKRMTEEYFNDQCEIGHTENCQTQDSETVKMIRSLSLPSTANDLLRIHRYSKASRLFTDLSLHGADQEIIEITGMSTIDINALSSFALDWYLDPAIYYARNFREYDSLVAYKEFANILKPQIQQGHWLSAVGIDTTDLPVLTDLFCASAVSTSNDRCIVQILNALARSSDAETQDEDNPHDYTNIAGGVPTKSFLETYQALGYSSSPVLVNYLSLWTLDSEKPIPPPPKDLTVLQRDAWNYATAVIFLDRAKQEAAPSANCSSLVASSLKYFKIVADGTVPGSFFRIPAKGHIDYIHSLKGKLCQKESSSALAK